MENKVSVQIVRDLCDRGYAFVPIDVDLLESADSAARIFLLAQSEYRDGWHFRRDDGTELGIVEEVPVHGGLARLRQLVLSFAHDLSRRRNADDPHSRACLGAINEFYRDMRKRVANLCFALDQQCGTADVVARIRSTFEVGDERATTLLLRSGVCGRRTLTQDLQADSVFSFFFGNEDSEVRLKNEGADKWELRSPPYGSALLFFGLKAGELGNPAFRPALYRVEEHNGRPLQGTVMHVQMKEDIPSSDTPNNVHQFAS